MHKNFRGRHSGGNQVSDGFSQVVNSRRTKSEVDKTCLMPSLKYGGEASAILKPSPRDEFAKQLVIANLPQDFMQYQVQDLCKPVRLLHVDIFKTKANITYAHVHVKGNEEIAMLENKLNGITIKGNVLLSRPLEKFIKIS
uniref:RRM domain-containing protein n=1 Tax=Clastoptera arizonana TaxID=38151 RepID=A0A1B6DSR9_9HEMI